MPGEILSMECGSYVDEAHKAGGGESRAGHWCEAASPGAELPHHPR